MSTTKSLGSEEKKDEQLSKWLIIAIIGVVLIWGFVSYWILMKYKLDAGPIGDAFGVVNSLFSSLAFAFLIYTSFLQKRELEYQRKELHATNEELRRSAEAHQKQANLIQAQMENTFQTRSTETIPIVDLVKKSWTRENILTLEFEVKMNFLIYNGWMLDARNPKEFDDSINLDARVVSEPKRKLYKEKDILSFQIQIAKEDFNKHIIVLYVCFSSILNFDYFQGFEFMNDGKEEVNFPQILAKEHMPQHISLNLRMGYSANPHFHQNPNGGA